jgi:hypothetical protein
MVTKKKTALSQYQHLAGPITPNVYLVLLSNQAVIISQDKNIDLNEK